MRAPLRLGSCCSAWERADLGPPMPCVCNRDLGGVTLFCPVANSVPSSHSNLGRYRLGVYENWNYETCVERWRKAI